MRLHLSVSGQGVVTAGDIICPPEIEIVNPELYLFTVDDPDAELDIEMIVSTGRGYSPSEERGKLPIGELPVDAVFSPIRKVNYDVTPARVGQMTNYDALTLEIWTDGSLRPQRALDISAKLLIRHLALFAGVDTLEAPAEPIAVPGVHTPLGTVAGPGAIVPGLAPAQSQAGSPEAGAADGRVYDVPIEELDLTVRVYNCLKRTGITKVGEVLAKMEKGPDEMLSIRNFGIKSLIELRGRLIEKGYLGEDDFPLEEN
jgi:DNA-directed RNA polymerase subunit alpha